MPTRIKRNTSPPSGRIYPIVLMVVLLGAHSAYASAFKIGGFEFDVTVGLDLVYTTNVEQEPDDTESEEEQEDYFTVARLSLGTSREYNENSTLEFEAGFAFEKHFVRDDLDTDAEPFGDISILQEIDLGRYEVTLLAGHRRTSETSESSFAPGGRKRRDVNTITEYGGGVIWEYSRLTLSGEYLNQRERHEEDEFKDGDEDRESFDAAAEWMINRRFDASYTYRRDRTKTPDGTGFQGWEETHFAAIEALVIEDPEFRYQIGFEKQDEGPVEGDWELIHIFSVQETYEFTKTVMLSIDARYTLEEDEEEDDITFIYNIELDHTMDRHSKQSLRLTREPRNTFGSNKDTDTTVYAYSLSKQQLLVRDLDFEFDASYTIDKPVDLPEEKTQRYVVILDNTRQLTQKLSRSLEYMYSYEDSNVSEPIREHRVTLSLDYTF